MRSELLMTIMILSLSAEALCYEVMVHEKISSSAIRVSTFDAYLRTNLNLQLTDGFENRTIQEWLENGSKWEDDTPRWKNHFYDPTTEMGLSDMVSGMPSLEWGRDYWSNDYNLKKARQSYYFALTQNKYNIRQAKFATIFRSLGQIIHLIHDLAVPAHVRNDSHPYKTETYFQQQRDMYEKYTNAALISENGLPKLKYDGYPAVDLAVFNNFDSFWIGGGRGLSEFTNSNFLSRNTNLDDAKYPAPVPIGEWVTKETIIDPWMGSMDFEVKYLQGYVTDHYRPSESKPLNRLSAYSYFDFEMQKHGHSNRVYSLNERIHKEYSDFLIPRAVGYSAGLLNYFFRGDIKLEFRGGASPGYFISNNSKEDMNGRFEVYYDNARDERIRILSRLLEVGAEKTSLVELPIVADAKEPGKYVLVFRGRMGNEDGAVAGYVTRRTLEITPPSSFVYSQADPQKDQVFTNISVKIKNTSSEEPMPNGSLQAVVRYKRSGQDRVSYAVSDIKADQKLEYGNALDATFDLTDSPIPLDATDVYLHVVYTGRIGSDTNAVAVGEKDISEPTPIDVFNNTDRSCVNGAWHPTAEAIDLVDTSSPKDQIADKWDVNPHILQNIYVKISSTEKPLQASPSEYDSVVPLLYPGQYKRAMYILTDYSFKYSFHSTWSPSPDYTDRWPQNYNVHTYKGSGVRNQTDYSSSPDDCGKDSWCRRYHYPVYYSIRGNDMWWGGGVVFTNWPYPYNLSCQGF